MKIIIINGSPRSGKSLFVELCRQHPDYHCYEFSTIDCVKEIMRNFGWNGNKTSRDRAFMSELKRLFVEWGDVPFLQVKTKLELVNLSHGDSNPICFVHCREPEEISKFVDGLGAKTLLIRRAAVETLEQSNNSDKNVFNFNYDYTIENNGTITELKQKAAEFLKEVIECTE